MLYCFRCRFNEATFELYQLKYQHHNCTSKSLHEQEPLKIEHNNITYIMINFIFIYFY